MDISINPSGVHSVGDDLAANATKALTKVARCLDSSSVAAQAHAGWGVSEAIGDCQQTWEKHLCDLVRQVDLVAEKMHFAATMTHQADTEAAIRLTRVLGDLSQ